MLQQKKKNCDDGFVYDLQTFLMIRSLHLRCKNRVRFFFICEITVTTQTNIVNMTEIFQFFFHSKHCNSSLHRMMNNKQKIIFFTATKWIFQNKERKRVREKGKRKIDYSVSFCSIKFLFHFFFELSKSITFAEFKVKRKMNSVEHFSNSKSQQFETVRTVSLHNKQF